MMGPRSPIIKSGPQAISRDQREVLAAMARLAKVIVPTRVPTLPSRYRPIELEMVDTGVVCWSFPTSRMGIPSFAIGTGASR